MDVRDKAVLLTGASGGIGRATAFALAAKGARLALAGRSEDAIAALARDIHGSIGLLADMTAEAAVMGMVRDAHAHFGRIDILINNAARGIYGAVEDLPIDAYRALFELNVIGPLVAMQAVIPIMRAQGGGAILNIGSTVSKNHYTLFSGYASAKCALNALTLTARAELKNDGIVIGLMHPGRTATSFAKNALHADIVQREAARMSWRTSLPPPDSPEHVAARIVEALQTGDAETFA